MKAKIREMLLSQRTYSEIVESIGCSKATISYHARKLGLERKPANVTTYDWSLISNMYDEGKTKNECQAVFGFSNGSWDAAVKRGDISIRPRALSLEEILVENRPQTGRGTLKRKLIKNGIFKEECSECGINTWMGKKLSLQLDHINGHSKDNRLENIRLLCPNCHSLTTTYAGKNVKHKISS